MILKIKLLFNEKKEMSTYYTENGTIIRNPEAYARTGAPMFKTKYGNTRNINEETDIYKLNLKII